MAVEGEVLITHYTNLLCFTCILQEQLDRYKFDILKIIHAWVTELTIFVSKVAMQTVKCWSKSLQNNVWKPISCMNPIRQIWHWHNLYSHFNPVFCISIVVMLATRPAQVNNCPNAGYKGNSCTSSIIKAATQQAVAVQLADCRVRLLHNVSLICYVPISEVKRRRLFPVI